MHQGQQTKNVFSMIPSFGITMLVLSEKDYVKMITLPPRVIKNFVSIFTK